MESYMVSQSSQWMDDQCQNEVHPPAVGMVFGSPNEAFEFYKLYSRQIGFGITRRTSHNFYGIKYDVTFACNKNRKPLNTNEKGTGIRKRGVLGTGCRARIVLRDRLMCGSWTIEEAIIDHNHELSPDCVRLMRCHRDLPVFVKKTLEVNELAGLAQSKSICVIFTQSGGVTKCSFTEKDMRNYISEVRRLQLKEGDAKALMKYFRTQQEKCPNFFYSHDLDDEGRLKNVFWADARSRRAYKYFGDVITFDTTYLTNRYRMPFAIFVGVNHHGQSMLLGCALLSNELKASFHWCFTTFLVCMHNKAPDAIITDQCPSICAAVADVFKHTRHRLCLWHIMKKIPEKCASAPEKDQVMHKICSAVYDSCDKAEFEARWGQLLITTNLGPQRVWFEDLYEKREKWVPIFVMNQFWAGMSTTQRSESMNAFFDAYINTKTSLKSFVERYDNALHSKWEKERQEDFRCKEMKPKMLTDCEFEKQFAESYTLQIFYKYQQEVKMLITCYCQFVVHRGTLTEFTIAEVNSQKKFKVMMQSQSGEYTCSCMSFEFKGIVCRHALCVCRQIGLDRLPQKYILARWRKDYIRSYIREYVPELPVIRGLDAYAETYVAANQLVLDLVEIAAQSRNLHLDLISGLSNLKAELVHKTEQEDGVYNDSDKRCTMTMSPESDVRDPRVVRSKGRPRSTRIKSGIEDNTATKRKKHCRKGTSNNMEATLDVILSQHMPVTATELLMHFEASAK